MKSHERRLIEVYREVLEPWGFVFSIIDGGKHLALVAKGPRGHRVRFTLSSSPRDPDAQMVQARQQARNWLDRNGMTSGRGRAGERRPRKAKRTRSIFHRFEVAVDPTTGPARDPWAALRGLVTANDDAEERAA